MAKAIFCIAISESQLALLIEQLKVAHFCHDDISVLFPNNPEVVEFAVQHDVKAPEEKVSSGAIGGLMGGTLGLLAGIAVLALSGLGSIIVAGPLMVTLSGALLGGALGGLAGFLINLGLPAHRAKHYETRIKKGHILVSIQVKNKKETQRAKAVLEQVGVEDILTFTHLKELPQSS